MGARRENSWSVDVQSESLPSSAMAKPPADGVVATFAYLGLRGRHSGSSTSAGDGATGFGINQPRQQQQRATGALGSRKFLALGPRDGVASPRAAYPSERGAIACVARGCAGP